MPIPSPVETPIELWGQAIADAGGTAEALIAGPRAHSIYHLTGVAVDAATSSTIPTFALYRNSVSPTNLLGNTLQGKRKSGRADDTIRHGESLIARWGGASTGTLCTVVIGAVENYMGGL